MLVCVWKSPLEVRRRAEDMRALLHNFLQDSGFTIFDGTQNVIYHVSSPRGQVQEGEERKTTTTKANALSHGFSSSFDDDHRPFTCLIIFFVILAFGRVRSCSLFVCFHLVSQMCPMCFVSVPRCVVFLCFCRFVFLCFVVLSLACCWVLVAGNRLLSDNHPTAQ